LEVAGVVEDERVEDAEARWLPRRYPAIATIASSGITTGGTMRRALSTVQPELSNDASGFVPPLSWELPFPEGCWCGLAVTGAAGVTGVAGAAVAGELGLLGAAAALVGSVAAARLRTPSARGLACTLERATAGASIAIAGALPKASGIAGPAAVAGRLTADGSAEATPWRSVRPSANPAANTAAQSRPDTAIMRTNIPIGPLPTSSGPETRSVLMTGTGSAWSHRG
jgi:hypothetical protein